MHTGINWHGNAMKNGMAMKNGTDCNLIITNCHTIVIWLWSRTHQISGSGTHTIENS